ncbi:hypothetical protein GECvBGOT_gp208c [Salmonella phage GEC_vB_GOT]|nr:hypothetical protein GECvBGOT_gp208c [Salmonella phage GEC_vB_GOT]
MITIVIWGAIRLQHWLQEGETTIWINHPAFKHADLLARVVGLAKAHDQMMDHLRTGKQRVVTDDTLFNSGDHHFVQQRLLLVQRQ